METILAIEDSLAGVAAATVLSTLLNVDVQLPKSEDIHQSLQLPRKSVIILTESQLRYLAALRRQGFAGAVLVLASKPSSKVIEKHRILRFGDKSHIVCESPWVLSALLTNIVKLIPLQPENLGYLQSELEIPANRLEQEVIPHLKNLQKGNCNQKVELEKIEESFNTLLQSTPVARHQLFNPQDPHSDQIQQKFKFLIDEMRSSEDYGKKNVALLQKIFDRWCKSVLDMGEDV